MAVATAPASGYSSLPPPRSAETFPQADAALLFNLAGSDDLALQIREGAPADVYAAASPRFPQELFAEGLVEVAIAREAPVDSALNHVTAPIVSLVPGGNRVRVRVGPIVAELTTPSVERLGLAVGEVVVASFKATATRLVPLG
jgi:ABC-type molybdate transport system substrate-binding protein